MEFNIFPLYVFYLQRVELEKVELRHLKVIKPTHFSETNILSKILSFGSHERRLGTYKQLSILKQIYKHTRKH